MPFSQSKLLNEVFPLALRTDSFLALSNVTTTLDGFSGAGSTALGTVSPVVIAVLLRGGSKISLSSLPVGASQNTKSR